MPLNTAPTNWSQPGNSRRTQFPQNQLFPPFVCPLLTELPFLSCGIKGEKLEEKAHLVDKFAKRSNQGANTRAPPPFSLSTFSPKTVSLNTNYQNRPAPRLQLAQRWYIILIWLYSDKNIYIGNIEYAENRFVFKFELFHIFGWPLSVVPVGNSFHRRQMI